MEKEIKKGQIQIAIDANKATVGYSKLAIEGAFLLNGAGAVALLTTREYFLYEAAMFLAIGACLAVCCACASYIVQFIICNYEMSCAKNEKPKQKTTTIFALRFTACSLLVASLILFIYGLSKATNTLDLLRSVW